MLTTQFLTCQLGLMAMSFFLEAEASEFQDLGKMLVVGFLLAVGAGVTFTIVRTRLRDKKPPAEQFISINSTHLKK